MLGTFQGCPSLGLGGSLSVGGKRRTCTPRLSQRTPFSKRGRHFAGSFSRDGRRYRNRTDVPTGSEPVARTNTLPSAESTGVEPKGVTLVSRCSKPVAVHTATTLLDAGIHLDRLVVDSMTTPDYRSGRTTTELEAGDRVELTYQAYETRNVTPRPATNLDGRGNRNRTVKPRFQRPVSPPGDGISSVAGDGVEPSFVIIPSGLETPTL